jgi:hypothetical protein
MAATKQTRCIADDDWTAKGADFITPPLDAAGMDSAATSATWTENHRGRPVDRDDPLIRIRRRVTAEPAEGPCAPKQVCDPRSRLSALEGYVYFLR